MKLCVDCFYYRRPTTDLAAKDYATCDATKQLNVVTGEWEYNFCWIERESLRPEACGVDAKLYEEPEPREMWQRDEPQGVTNWDTGWNGVHACEEN